MSQIKRNYGYNLIYQILAIILPFVTTPYISRVLGAEAIGIYSYGYSIAYYFSMFALLGLSNYGNREIARVSNDKDKCSKVFWSIYAFQFINAVCISFLYLMYCWLISDNVKLSLIFGLSVLASIFDITWFFNGTEKFKLTVVRNTFVKFLGTILVFMLVKKASDLWIYCLIIAASNFVSQIVLWPYLFANVKKCIIKIKDIYGHLKPCLILFVPVIAISLYKYMDKIMLGSMVGDIELGFYENSEKINQLPSIFIMSLGTVMLPRVTNLISCGKKKEAYKYTNNSIIFAMFLSSALCFGLMGVSKEFVPIFLGTGYLRCIDILYVLLTSSIFIAVANVVRTQILIPYGKDSSYVVSVVLGAVVNLIVNMFLIPIWGSVGAAIGTFLAEGVVCMVQIIYSMKNGLLQVQSILLGVPFVIIGIVMLGVLNLSFFDDMSLVVGLVSKVIIGAVIYVVLCFLYYTGFLKRRIDFE